MRFLKIQANKGVFLKKKRRTCRRAKNRSFERSSQLERENMQRMEDIDTGGDDKGTVMLEKNVWNEELYKSK